MKTTLLGILLYLVVLALPCTHAQQPSVLLAVSPPATNSNRANPGFEIVGFYGAANAGGTVVRTVEKTSANPGDLIRVSGTGIYDGDWPVLQAFRYKAPNEPQLLWGHRIAAKWKGFPLGFNVQGGVPTPNPARLQPVTAPATAASALAIPRASAQQPEALRKQFLDFKAKAEKGDAMAQFNLSVCYREGIGVKSDHTEEVKWCRKSAEQGRADAQLNMGISHFLGRGVEQSHVEAVRWWRKAAEQGLAQAQHELGKCYAEGRGVAKNAAEAVKWWRKAAEQNFADAQFYLGVAYSNGWGVPEDFEKAAWWFRRAAEQNQPDAMVDLGVLLDRGKGVPKDEAEAVKWYRKAAELNHAIAQCSLGGAYAHGEGVAQNHAEAYAWWSLAAKECEQAAKNRDAWTQMMTPEQLAAGKKRTEELRAQIEARLESAAKAQPSRP